MSATSPRPYNWLARFYDQLTPEAAAMNRHARRHILGRILPRPRRELPRLPRRWRGLRSVCDVGCGTGETALDMARRGLRVYGVDNSPTLCRIVRAKARRQRLHVRVLCADMRSFRLPEPVDLVTCEFASLNHVARHTDLERVFRAVARTLRPGGYFLFDVNTCRAFAEQTPAGHWVQTRDFKLVLHGRYDPRRRQCTLDFEWFLPAPTQSGQAGKLWRHARERVEHICWSDAEIRRALRRAGFRRLRFWDGLDVRPPIPGARRGYDAYYLAQKT